MAEVIRVFGRADSFDIEFTRHGDQWQVDVPPDMTDGTYAVQLTAIDINNVHAYRVGELYMVRGICCFKIREIPYRSCFVSREFSTALYKQKYVSLWDVSSYTTDFEKKYCVQFKKKEHRKSAYQMKFDTNLKTIEAVPYFSLEVAASKALINLKTDFYVEYLPKTKIFIRKGCLCHGGK